jgi:hypothetical protein
MATGLHPAEGGVIEKKGHNLNQKKDPLRGPGKNKGVNKNRGGRRVEQGHDEPDAHPGD